RPSPSADFVPWRRVRTGPGTNSAPGHELGTRVGVVGVRPQVTTRDRLSTAPHGDAAASSDGGPPFLDGEHGAAAVSGADGGGGLLPPPLQDRRGGADPSTTRRVPRRGEPGRPRPRRRVGAESRGAARALPRDGACAAVPVRVQPWHRGIPPRLAGTDDRRRARA